MITREKQGAVDVLSLDQPLKADLAEELAAALGQSLSAGQPMAVIDMQRATMVDSAGLEVLADQQKLFEHRGGALKLASATPLVRDVLRITGVGERFEIFGETKTAVGSFNR